MKGEQINNLPPEGATKEFLLEEQKQRRLELDSLITNLENDQRNGLLFTAAIWAWLLTNADKVTGAAQLIVSVLPACIMAFFFYRYFGLVETIRLIAEYTRRLESAFHLPPDLGWQTYVADLRTTGRWQSLGKRTRLLWISLIALNAIIGVVYYVR
jgi:hypothetical protein